MYWYNDNIPTYLVVTESHLNVSLKCQNLGKEKAELTQALVEVLMCEQFLTLLFDFPFEKSLHGVFRGHVQRKLSFTVHRPDLSTVLY